MFMSMLLLIVTDLSINVTARGGWVLFAPLVIAAAPDIVKSVPCPPDGGLATDI